MIKKRLPLRLSGTNSGIAYCCLIVKGIHDSLETQDGWHKGDISLCDGWFSILYGEPEESLNNRNRMIMGRLEEGSLEKVKHFPD